LFINFIKIEFKFSLVNKNNKYFILKIIKTEMNIYTQIVSITLGGLLSISEILPFIRNVKTNGILHFIIDSLIDNENQDLENLIEHESLLNHSNGGNGGNIGDGSNSGNGSNGNGGSGSETGCSSKNYKSTENNDNENDDNMTNKLQDVKVCDKKLDMISSELRKLDVIDHNLHQYFSKQHDNDKKLKEVIKDDINNILQELKEIKVDNSDVISNKYDKIMKDVSEYVSEYVSEHFDIIKENDIKKSNESSEYNIDSLLSSINTQLQDIKNDKTDSFAKKNVEEIVEMILQHLRDLQRSQLQWTQNYGENNIKNDLKFENIIEHINKLNELLESSNKISHRISNQISDQNFSSEDYKHQLKHQLKQEMMSNIEEINDQFLKQMNLLKEMTSQFETRFEDISNKVDEILIRSNENPEKKKKRSHFLGGNVKSND
jgi:hypothetical protein